MADDVTLNAAAGTFIAATDDIGSGRQAQLVKPVFGADGVANMVAIDSALPTGVGSTTLTGTAVSLNADAVASTDVSAYLMGSITVTGTFTGTMTMQGSNDNSNWFTLSMQTISASNYGSFQTSANLATGTAYIFTIPLRYIRIRMTAYTSGSATVFARLYNGAHSGMVPSTQSVSGTVTASATGATSTAADGDTAPVWSSFRSLGYGFNGVTYDRFRVPRIFTSATATASGNTAVWTPTSGKRFNLLRFQLFLTANAATTSGAVITVKFQDATTDIGIAIPVYVPASGGTTLGGWQSGWIDIGDYGYRSSAINQALNVNLSAALSPGSLGVLVTGIEE